MSAWSGMHMRLSQLAIQLYLVLMGAAGLIVVWAVLVTVRSKAAW